VGSGSKKPGKLSAVDTHWHFERLSFDRFPIKNIPVTFTLAMC